VSDSWLRPYEHSLPSDTIVMPVVAYRIWYVPLQPILQLRSYWMPTPWDPCVRVEAECRNHLTCVCNDDNSFWASVKEKEGWDADNCKCSAGIYGMKTLDQGFELWRDQIEKMDGMEPEEPVTNRVALGKVFLWGKVVECEKGFRGQYGYPAALYWMADNSPALAEMYRVPLLTIKDHHRFPIEPPLCP
jgi:hypothetical protein